MWSRFWSLTRSERYQFLLALVLLPLSNLAVRPLGFSRWRFAMEPGRPAADDDADLGDSALTRARTAARMVASAARNGPCTGTCLQQSIVLCWLLRLQGLKGDLRVGVRRQEHRLEAHAWVEYLGVVLNDEADIRQRFAPFDAVG